MTKNNYQTPLIVLDELLDVDVLSASLEPDDGVAVKFQDGWFNAGGQD